MEYEIAGDALRQTLRMQNISEKEAEITDLSVFLPTNSSFVWEEDSGRKVIGHHFVGGNGSFSLLKRCDGKGPHILMIPEGDTGFEYWELKEGRFARYEEVEGSISNCSPETYTNLFIHSEKAASRAKKMGTRLRHTPTTRQLAPGEEAVYTWKFIWVWDDQEARNALAENGSYRAAEMAMDGVVRNVTYNTATGTFMTAGDSWSISTLVQEKAGFSPGLTDNALYSMALGNHQTRIAGRPGEFLTAGLFLLLGLVLPLLLKPAIALDKFLLGFFYDNTEKLQATDLARGIMLLLGLVVSVIGAIWWCILLFG